jgi:undecaprenyl-diphosphatase
MCAACGFSMLKFLLKHPAITTQQILLFIIGTLVSFLVAWAVIKWFMAYVRRRTFTPFALYRILLAIIVFLAT